jgi:hypothetical protein
MMNAPEQTASLGLLQSRNTQSELDRLRRHHQALGQQLLAVLDATANRDRTIGERAVVDVLLLEMQHMRTEIDRAAHVETRRDGQEHTTRTLIDNQGLGLDEGNDFA